MKGLTDAQAGKIAEHLKLSPDGPSYEAVSAGGIVSFLTSTPFGRPDALVAMPFLILGPLCVA